MINSTLNTLLDACGVKDKSKWCVVNLPDRRYEFGEPENMWKVMTTKGRSFNICTRSKGQCFRLLEQSRMLGEDETIRSIELLCTVPYVPLDDNERPVLITEVK